MNELASLVTLFGRAVLDYGVFAAGWLAFFYERRRNNHLVGVIVTYFTKVKMLEGYTHGADNRLGAAPDDSGGGQSHRK